MYVSTQLWIPPVSYVILRGGCDGGLMLAGLYVCMYVCNLKYAAYIWNPGGGRMDEDEADDDDDGKDGLSLRADGLLGLGNMTSELWSSFAYIRPRRPGLEIQSSFSSSSSSTVTNKQ